MSRLLPLPFALPLLAAGIGILVSGRTIALRRFVGLGTSGIVLAYAIALVTATADGSVLVTQVGAFRAGVAIPFVADTFAALMVLVAALMVTVCTVFAVARGEDEQRFFHPLVLVLEGGVCAAFLTGDLFNLFVSFEVMLVASYVLLTLGGSREQVRAGAIYVTTNLLASAVLVSAVALVYADTGTVNMAALAAGDTPPSAVAGLLLLVAFGVKASLVPLHGWLPRSYPATSPAVAAMFSGLLTKVGVYAIYRVYSLVYGADPEFRTTLLVIASVTMVIGVLGAVGRNGMREILSFHIVSQVGYMVMGLGLFGPLGLAGGIFYILHHIVVKTSLFLSAGAVETIEGTGDLERVGGVARRHPVLAASFAVSALSLAGVPPLSGFFAKLMLVRGAFEQTEYAMGAVAIVVGFFTLLSMVKIWNAVFWGEDVGEPTAAKRAWPALVAPALVLAAISVALGAGAHGLASLSTTAAGVVADPSLYVEAVLGR